MARKGNSPASVLWDENPQERDNPRAPSVSKMASNRKWVRRALYAIAFGIVPITCFAVLGNIVNATTWAATDATRASISSNYSAGKVAAVEAMRAWLAQTPAPLPGGRMSSWDGYETRDIPLDDKGVRESDVAVELHHFTLTSGNGAEMVVFQSDVEVRVSPTFGVKVSGSPTLMPGAPSATNGWPTVVTWPGYPSGTTSKAVTQAVTAWAKAFSAGTSDDLRLAVGDPDAKHSYLPLTGIESAAASITASADIPLADPEAKPVQMLVRVSLALVWKGQEAPAADDATARAALPTVVYDVLVDGANTAAPRVVSWGGPGTGPELSAYSTAIDGVAAVAASPTEDPAPSATEEVSSNE
ncbi:hypothetical protein [Rathayibacter rathayi]|nr:hypothetical protein [Rathayibacter rathayi]